MGACRIIPLDLPPFGYSRLCHGPLRGEPVESCYHDRCVAGVCARDAPDSTFCSTPAHPDCLVSWVCDPNPVLFEDPDVLFGCRPATECYLGGTADGTLDGECIPPFSSPPTAQCLVCDPFENPARWSGRPAGALCEDTNVCILDESCDGDGHCVGECDLSNPSCTAEFCGAG
jgi:hypothetical protein